MNCLRVSVLALLVALTVACGGQSAPAETQAPDRPAAAQPRASATPRPTATIAPVAVIEGGEYGRGAYFRGAATAPLTIIEYSDFLWGACRAYVLGPGREIIDQYVATGQVKLVFWPMLDLGANSRNAAAAVTCAGQQDVALYWRLHDYFFENQGDIFRAERDDFIRMAVDVGAAAEPFTACYDSGEGHAIVEELNQIRRDGGIVNRPTIDINGTRIFGAQSFSVFDQAIQAALP